MASCIAFPWRFLNAPLLPRVTKQSFTFLLTISIYAFFVTNYTFMLCCTMAPTTDIFSRIPSDDSDSDTPEKCRKRRRRRIEMRRMRTFSAQLSLPQSQSQPQFQPSTPRQTPPQNPHFLTKLQLQPPKMGLLTPSLVENPMPDFGCISIQGLSQTMDDAWFVKENFCRPDIFGGNPLHLFSIYDGHGGSRVSMLCKKMMQKIMAEELTPVHISKAAASDNGSSFSLGQAPQKQQYFHGEIDEEEWEDVVRGSIERSFKRMAEVALSTCACGENVYVCTRCQQMQMVDIAFVGSTAVVALVTPRHIVVANCGDSRAVLCRDGRPIPLPVYHKAEISDEVQRIGTAGGKIVYLNGVRVYGILNTMSRSLGDNFLKSVITSQPEISITQREAEDECLIVASDGIWDVISYELACEIASACLKDGGPATASTTNQPQQLMFPSKTKFAAAILCRLALGRGSHHNITLIVVDLRSLKGNAN
ncbi:hypothetical protein Pint_17328 [Pistacia integerrima]|uniref:Uncharacterized protein n=1 Tax=Pistacia integerrima TaxID=434235 RepID=A0ACC0Z2C0_9ROSI|nr:hypothetical protein Pint_17328 [Pistacia integerrima]